jgi:glycosyltransferase involved in cell wall biosynthesis
MNILYISKIYNNKASGLFQSIPSQIAAQSLFDNVFWYNMTDTVAVEWIEKTLCHSLNEYPTKKIKDLPVPFNNPDLVIFEGIYIYPFSNMVFEVWRKKIPYIIIPRGSLTMNAQKMNSLKKKIMNMLFFKVFTRKALLIQYLTENEYNSSTNYWNNNHLIIPNGITPFRVTKTKFSKEILKGVFIGRISTFYKGLDLLIDACILIKEELRDAKCSITFYGPDEDNNILNLSDKIQRNCIQDILHFVDKSVFGSEKENLLLGSDFFVLTSRSEGHPMGLIEALAYGLPCIVTEGTNMTKEIIEYDAGWASETSVEGIIKSFRYMISDRDCLSIKSQNAIRLSKSYDWIEIAKNTSALYHSIVHEL